MLATGTAVAQLTAFIAIPFISRSVAPDQYGQFTLWLTIVTVLSALASWRYEQAIVATVDDGEAKGLWRLCLAAATVSGAAAAACLLILYAVDGSLLMAMGWSAVLLPAGVTLSGMIFAYQESNNRESRYAIMAKSRALMGISTALFQVIGATLLGVGWALAAGFVLGTGLAVVYQAKHQEHDTRAEPIPRLTVLRRYRHFPLKLGPAQAMRSLSGALPVIVITIAGGVSAAAFYGISVRLVAAPATLIAGAMGSVYYQRAAAAHWRGGGLERLFRKTLLVSGTLGLTLVFGGWAVGPLLSTGFLGAEWSATAPYVQVGAAITGMTLAVGAVEKSSLIAGWLGSILLRQGLRLFAYLALLTATSVADLTPLIALRAMLAIEVGLFLVDVTVEFLATRSADRPPAAAIRAEGVATSSSSLLPMRAKAEGTAGRSGRPSGVNDP